MMKLLLKMLKVQANIGGFTCFFMVDSFSSFYYSPKVLHTYQ